MALPIVPDIVYLVPYKHYRVKITEPGSAYGVVYATLSRFRMYETTDSTTDLAAESTPTASSTYSGSYAPSNAIDSSPSSYWCSVANQPTPQWINFELPVAKIVRKFVLNNAPHTQKCTIEGSNDGVNYVSLLVVDRYLGEDTVLLPNRILQGVSLKSDGTPCERIDIFNWDTKDFVGSIAPDSTGLWKTSFFNDPLTKYMIVHHGGTGYKPQVDGPCTPYYYAE